jgi:serine/threonine protein kinase
MTGQTIKHYKILEKLGAGGMGEVFLAEDTELDRKVALKFLPPYYTSDKELKSRFRREAKAAAALNHPNIVTVYEIGEDEGRTYIAMEYVEGKSLRETVSSDRLSVDNVIDIISQICDGLNAAHQAGIIHRDIKPENIIVDKSGRVRILDFGLARIHGKTKLTRDSATLGTISYMSPEQFQGQPVDHRADIWAVGVVLYEMLAGELPFQGEYDQAVMYSVCNEAPQPVSSLRADVPVELEQVVESALQKNVDARYQSAGEVLEAIQALQQGAKIVRPALLQRKSRARKRITILAATMVFAATVAFLLYSIFTKILEKTLEKTATAISPNRIAVLPFTVHGSPDFAYLADGMMDLLSIDLDGAGELRRVDPYSLQSFIKREALDPIDPERGQTIAKHFGAGLYVMGSVHASGKQIQISASLYDVQDGLQHIAQTKRLQETKIFEMVDDIATQLLFNRSDGIADRLQQLAAKTTTSFLALKADLTGEAKIRSGQYELAVDAFDLAVEEDSTFALAYYKKAQAASSSPERFDERFDALAQAMHFADRLPERDRTLLQAKRFRTEGAVRQAINLCRKIVSDYPNDAGAWQLLGVSLIHYGPRLGYSNDQARVALYRAHTLDPEKESIIGFMQWIAGKDGSVAEFDSLTLRRLELAPQGTYSLFNRLHLPYLRENQAARAKIIEEASQISSSYIWYTSISVAAYTENDQWGKSLAKLLTEPSRPAFWQARGHEAVALIELSRGHLSVAKEELAVAEMIYPAYPIEEVTLLFLTPLVQISHQEINQRKEKVVLWNDDKIWSPIRKNYALGLLNAHLGDYDAALAHADSLELHANELEKQESGIQPIAMARDLSHSVRARVFLERNDPVKGLEELRQIQLEGWWRAIPQFLVESQAYERYMRAKMLKASGRYEEAIRWLSTLGTAHYPEIVYRAPKHRLLGEIYEEINQPKKAIEHYSRFIELWQDCDMELRPLVEEAQDRIDQLKSGE